MSEELPSSTPGGELILYETEDGQSRIECRLIDGTVWLSQALIGELFQRSKQTVSEHLQNIFDEGELNQMSVVRNFRTTAADEKNYEVAHYNLEAILAVGFRVKSVRGTQFRRWANTRLKEYLVKGFTMDDERLKNPNGWDYFDELLVRIRDIRASEKRFYQKVRDLFALSSDYRADDRPAQAFFAEVQNKLLYAVTRQTAAEIVVARSDPNAPNMALTTWKGTRVRKDDVIIAKNYLTAEEVDTLNRLVAIYLDQAELRVRERKDLTLAYWRQNVDRLLEFNERPILNHAGGISAEEMKTIAHDRYNTFDTRRRTAEARAADAADLQALEGIAEEVKRKKKPK